MECPFCQQFIPDDSFFCDQCGKEMMLCPVCKKPGKGKACIFDGNKLVPASGQPQAVQSGQADAVVTPQAVASTPQSASESIPQIILANSRLGIQLKPQSGDILGRKSGAHASLLGNFLQISGSHASIEFKNGQWWITDLNSTNGTKVSASPCNWSDVPVLPAQQARPLPAKGLLLLANIEFMIDIPFVPSDKTQRL